MVLILIVVDDGLVHRILLKDSLANAKVLILIVVDNGLVLLYNLLMLWT